MMFHAKKDYAYDNIDSAKVDQFIVKPGDYILIRVFSNNGYQLVDVKSYVNFTYDALSIPYVVQKSGFVALPLLDTIYVKGLTIPQLETKLSMLYSDYFVNPFVMVNITNNQVVVFNGRGESTVVPFTDNDMTLIQAISAANGIEKNATTTLSYPATVCPGNLSDGSNSVFLPNSKINISSIPSKLGKLTSAKGANLLSNKPLLIEGGNVNSLVVNRSLDSRRYALNDRTYLEVANMFNPEKRFFIGNLFNAVGLYTTTFQFA